MSTALKVLIVEDSASDAGLMVRQLQHGGFDVSHLRVETAEQLRMALQQQPWDVFLCDFSLPGFDARIALAMLHDTGLDIPFIVVSGSIGDETAIELMRTGACDYLMKDNLLRLAPVVERELREVGLRRERRAADERLRLAASVFESADEGITLTDADAHIVAVNPAFERITGYSEAEVLGKNPSILHSGRQDPPFYRNLWATLLACGHWSGEVWNRRKSGDLFPEWLTISAVQNKEGKVTHFAGLFSDRSAIFEARERVDFLAHHDILTGLPNRALLRDRIHQAIETAAVDQHKVALLLINIDRLGRVNEHRGFDAGDALLKEMAVRLHAQLPKGCSLARLGSDEFVMLLSQVTDADSMLFTAQRLLEVSAQPFRIGAEEVSITASIGIAIYPDDADNPNDLLKGANTVLSLVKNEGGNGIRFLTSQMNAHALRRLTLEHHLQLALAHDELHLHYQPQVSLSDGRISGVEALIRWRSPDLGLISPTDFIPLAEDVGLILPIGEWVMRTACAQNKAWQEAGLPPVRMAVNVSGRQIATGALPAMVRQALDESGLEAKYLEVELTESVMMRDTDSSLKQIAELRQMGVTVALDDFGTGYSSLSYLSRFALDKLKIDQGFVANITTEPRSAAIAKATIALARSLDMTVIAEGVESEGQLGYLRRAGCDEIQGFIFSRPVPPDELALLLGKESTLGIAGAPLTPTRTLLLLDDEPSVLSALTRLLRREGYKILAAHSAREAFELLAIHTAQVIISDQRMPDMNGTEFLARASELYPDTVRMVLSGYSDLQAVTDAVNRGSLYKFLSKPWDDDALRETIRDAFRKAEREQERRLEKST
jgi:diguanylate cyclase (GGDEF)-like protein/PAS domain S-box-containing protein